MLRLLALTLLGLCLAFPAPADEARIYLSSHAPHGLAGADSSLVWACGDTTRVDTLYLSFDPGRACTTFVAMSANLWFHALTGDSLSGLWAPVGAYGPPRGIKVEYGPGSASDPPSPWQSFGAGLVAYVRPSRTAGMLRLVYAVPPQGGATVEAGRRYSFARVLLRRPAAGTPGCDQPVCVEWLEANMAYSIQDNPKITEGVKYVGLNTASGLYGCVSPPASTAPPPSRPSRKPSRSK